MGKTATPEQRSEFGRRIANERWSGLTPKERKVERARGRVAPAITTRELARETGATESQVKYWLRRGYVTSSTAPAEIRMIRDVLAKRPKAIANALRAIANSPGAVPAYLLIVGQTCKCSVYRDQARLIEAIYAARGGVYLVEVR